MPPNRQLDQDDLDSGPENTIQSRAPTAEDPSLERTTDRRIVPDDNEPPSMPLPARSSTAAPPPRAQFGSISTPTQFTPKDKTPTAPPPPLQPPPQRSMSPVPQPLPARGSSGPMPARTSHAPSQPVRASAPPRQSAVPLSPARPPPRSFDENAPTHTPPQGQDPRESRGRMPAHPQTVNLGQVHGPGGHPSAQVPAPPPSPPSPSQSQMQGMHTGGYQSAMMGAAPPVIQPQPMSQRLSQPGPPPPGHTHSGFVPPSQPHGTGQAMVPVGAQSLAIRADAPRDLRASPYHITRGRAYSFIIDQRGNPIELGSGRSAKAFLGEERWLESKTDFRREIVIKILQRGVSEEEHMRFQMEQELLERVQGHPNIVELLASGENEDPNFLPPSIRDKVDTVFMILERLEMSLEDRLKGSRNKAHKDDLLLCDMRERIFRVLDYMIPIASAIEYTHLVLNICHRDLKPANVLIKTADPNLRGAAMEVRLADFNVAKMAGDGEVQIGVTALKAAVPGSQFFQSPEQETNLLELLVSPQNGSPEVEYFEDFYIQIGKNDTFSLWNRDETYPILYADRARKRLVLARPYREVSETNVRARIQKGVGRPADIYSLGAMLYHLISGAYANPKTLYDAFHKFVEYEKADENNTIESYLMHEYGVINSLRAPKTESQGVAPADRFFSYKHYLDGNGELIDPNVMLIVAKCMIRNKPDSYCQAHDLETRGISELVQDLINLYALYGVHPAARPTHLARRAPVRRRALGVGLSLERIKSFFRKLFTRQKS